MDQRCFFLKNKECEGQLLFKTKLYKFIIKCDKDYKMPYLAKIKNSKPYLSFN